MIIAFDGPAGVGKSTIAKLIADKYDFFFLNSGNFYRAVTYSLLRDGGNPENEDEIIFHAKTLNPSISDNHLFLDSIDVNDELHTDLVDKWVASHSAIVPVREAINHHLRRIASNMNIVCEGRDMTTVVFPNADCKFFLDAAPSIRARRRFNQGTSNLTLEEIENAIIERDQIDRNKKVGGLKIAKNATYIDTSGLTIAAVCEKVISIIQIKNEKN